LISRFIQLYFSRRTRFKKRVPISAGLVKSPARFSETLRVLTVAKVPKISTRKAKQWGPALVFEKLWRSQGLPRVIERFATGRRFQFDVQKSVFALALQGLCQPGSDPQVEVPHESRDRKNNSVR
jgi:hypothetical protein